MPPARRPEFEPSFGSRPTEPPLEAPNEAPNEPPNEPNRLRDRRARQEALEGGGDAADADLSAPSEPRDAAIDPGLTSMTAEPVDVPEPDPIGPPPRASGRIEPTLPPKPPVSEPPAVDPDRSETPEGFDEDEAEVASSSAQPGRIGNRWFRARRRLVAGCALAVVLGLVYYLVSLAQVWTTGRADNDGPVDAIVVMGAAQYDGRPSPQLAARLDHVVELWPTGVAPLVVVTGGNIPGDRFTEAEASATYLVERGVPESALILENEGSTSYESLEAVADILDQQGVNRVLIVTDPYHALRSKLIADEVGLRPSVSSTDTSVVTGGDSLRRHLEEAGGVAVGRIIGFDRLSSLVD